MSRKSFSTKLTYFPENYVSDPSILPPGKVLTKKYTNVGAFPKWKDYGRTPTSAINKISGELFMLERQKRITDKHKKDDEISGVEKKISYLENLKKQALEASSFYSYGSELVLPKVTGKTSDDLFYNNLN